MRPIILFVGEDPNIFDFISDDISDRYSVLTAIKGEETLNMIEIEHMISGPMGPAIDGFELCKIIKSNFDHSNIPVILLAAKSAGRSNAGLPKPAADTITYSRSYENFLNKLNLLISTNMQNPNLDVEYIANMMNMSKATLYRKVKVISNISINELINITRLKTAAKLLEEDDHRIYQVASLVGYSTQSHFARNFLKKFGSTPTKYQQMKRNQRKRITS